MCLRATAATPSDELLAELNQHGGNVNAKVNHSPLIDLAAKYLVEHDADIEACDDFARTALLVAARHSKPEIAKYLVERGADVKARNGYGRTALHFASA